MGGTAKQRQQAKATKQKWEWAALIGGFALNLMSLGYSVLTPEPNFYVGSSLFLFGMALLAWALAHALEFRWLGKCLTVLAALAMFVGLDYRFYRTEFEKRALYLFVEEPKYVPPRGPGIRIEGTTPPPSDQMCRGLSEQAELECLCPRPLKYALTGLPPPSDNNYATEVTITAVREPIYRLRLFSRTQLGYATLKSTAPYGNKQATSALGTLAYDPYSVVMHSSAPQNEYKVIFHTAEGLRLKCINQEN